MMSENPEPETQDLPVLSEIDARGVATVTLNRPRVNNAYDGDMIERLLDAISRLGADPAVRVIVIRGNGRLFQAGADLNWLAQVSEAGEQENLEISRKTTNAVRFLDTCPKPALALVHGGCFGGGIGVLAACDLVVASEEALFSISEVRWGLIPGPIIPQLAAKIGVGQLRRYALTGERFGAEEAKRIGLVSETCATGALDETAAPIIESLLRNGPRAIKQTKKTIADTAGEAVDDGLAETLARAHAAKRQTREAAEGLASFRERREADWYPEPLADGKKGS